MLPQAQKPVLLLAALFSRYEEILAWGERAMTERWGPVVQRSERFRFVWSDYYEASMGSELLKYLVAFERLVDPAELAAIKLETNAMEKQAAAQFAVAESRPLNLDPGYLTEAKLVLATTKDRDHRVYLQQGIFAEVTLHYQGGKWKSRPWTYADYEGPSYHQFLDACREYLRGRYRALRDERGA